MSKVLRKKNGIETLDLNDFVTEVFTEAGIFTESEFYRDMDLDSVVEAVLSDKKDKKGDKPDFTSGARKGDDSKTKPGTKDFEKVDAEEEEEEETLEKGKKGKKGKKPEKGGGLDDEDADAAADQTAYDEATEYAQPEEDEALNSGLDDKGMTELMSELDELFKEIDWSAIAEDEEEEGEEDESQDIDGNDYGDGMTERTPNESSDEDVGTPSEDEST